MKLKKFNFKIVNSTNDLAIQLIKNTNNKSGIVIAERQKKGRGQYGKKWTSFKGNLFVSIFFKITKVQLSLKDLTKVNCLLVKKLLSNFYNGKITCYTFLSFKVIIFNPMIILSGFLTRLTTLLRCVKFKFSTTAAARRSDRYHVITMDSIVVPHIKMGYDGSSPEGRRKTSQPS